MATAETGPGEGAGAQADAALPQPNADQDDPTLAALTAILAELRALRAAIADLLALDEEAARGWRPVGERVRPQFIGDCGSLRSAAFRPRQDLPNVSPDAVDPAKLIYAWPTRIGVRCVRDAGHALAFAGDYPTLADLALADLPAGHYATCCACGQFRLGSAPVGALTCDLRL